LHESGQLKVPELPEIVVYVEALQARVSGRRLERIDIKSPFFLRSVNPPLEAVFGRVVTEVRRLGKRIVLVFEEELFLIVHLMIAGRLRWRDRDQPFGLGPKLLLAAIEFETGTLYVTEAGSKKRASLHLVRGDDLPGHERAGVEPLDVDLETFAAALTREGHTLKRALTDPELFSGIGNAFSDEILHAARLSPLKLTRTLTDEEVAILWRATRDTLTSWMERLRREAAGQVPEKVTAFHEAMAVHGRFRKPCPVCGSPVQRIVYAENECNYCATCQTGGKLLADRSLSRLLKDDWPKRLE
jgi:formamidopyrimidine-DNA glycosylase